MTFIYRYVTRGPGTIVSVYVGAILKATNSYFQKGILFCRRIHVKKVMRLLASIFEQPSYIAIVRKPPFDLNIYVLQQQQDLGQRFGTSKMHLSPPPPSVLGRCPF